MTGSGEGLREITLQPKKLRRFHLGGDTASDVAQNLVIAAVDFSRFAGGTMVHPDDDVAIRITGRADGNWRTVSFDEDESRLRRTLVRRWQQPGFPPTRRLP